MAKVRVGFSSSSSGESVATLLAFGHQFTIIVEGYGN